MIINGRTKIIILMSLIAVLLGIYFYKNYTSIENRSRRLARNEINDWFYKSKSIEYQNPNTRRDTQSINEVIGLKKAVNKVDDDWQFEYEDWDLHEVNYTDYMIDYTYFFKNTKTDELKIFKEQYYYDLNLDSPIPLKSSISLKSGDNYKLLEEKSLWEGDFDSYCKQVN